MHFRTSRPRLVAPWLCACLIGVASPLFANGFRNPPDGAAALARAGGRIAFIDDASAITHNPANLVELERFQVLQSLTLGYSPHEVDLDNGQHEATDDNLKTLPNLYLAGPIGNGQAVGIAITTPYGQSTVWPKDGAFHYTAPYFAQMRLVNINPTYARRITDTLSIGVGVDVFISDIIFKQYFPWSQVTMNPDAPDGNMEFHAHGWGIGANAGATWQFLPRHRLALTWRSPVTIDYEGDMQIDNIPAGIPGVQNHAKFESSITFPQSVTLGYGWQATDKFSLSSDIEWIEFSSFDKLPLDVDANSALLPGPALTQDWNDIFTFGLAGEYRFNPTWSLRGSWNYLPSPIPDHAHAPTILDADRNVFSIGVGWKHGRHSVDVAYAYSLFGDREVHNNNNSAYNGDYDLDAHLLQLSYGWSF